MRSLVVALALAVPGCALINAQAPTAERRRDQPPICHSGKRAVFIDSLTGAVLGFTALVVAGESGSAAIVTGLVAAAYVGSAVAGNSSANQCRDAIEEYQSRTADSPQMGGLGIAPGAPPPEDDLEPRPGVPDAVVDRSSTDPKPVESAVVAAESATAGDPDDVDVEETQPESPREDDAGRWREFWREVSK